MSSHRLVLIALGSVLVCSVGLVTVMCAPRGVGQPPDGAGDAAVGDACSGDAANCSSDGNAGADTTTEPHEEFPPCGLSEPSVSLTVSESMNVVNVESTICDSNPSSFAQLSYHEFPNACRAWSVWNGQDYSITGVLGVTHVASDGVSYLGGRDYFQEFGEMRRWAFVGEQAIFLGGRTKEVENQYWLETMTLDGTVMLPKQTLEFYGSSHLTAWHDEGLLVVTGRAPSMLAWRRFGSDAQPLGPTYQASFEESLPFPSYFVWTGDMYGLFQTRRSSNSSVLYRRACPDASMLDGHWHETQFIGMGMARDFSVHWAGDHYAMAWIERFPESIGGPAYIMFVRMDGHGSVLGTPLRLEVGATPQDLALAVHKDDGYLLGWIAVEDPDTWGKLHMQRISSQGEVVDCRLKMRPPLIDFGSGPSRLAAPPAFVGHNGQEWFVNFCTLPIGGGPTSAQYGALMRFNWEQNFP